MPNKGKKQIEKQEVREEHSSPSPQVNLTRLQPEKLLIVPVCIGDTNLKLQALIDTGATNNLIKLSSVRELELSIDRSSSLVISGLGGASIKTVGKVRVDVTLYELQFKEVV